jgi:thymidylate kinase
MIIEFFGPPGAGKTTLARALFCELRKRGYATEMALIHQPDRASILDPSGFGYALGRIARGMVNVIAMASHPIGHKDTFKLVVALLRILPPRNPIWFVRISQYLLRLSEIWRRSSNVDPIIIFDQGFIQAICSLAVFSRTFDEKSFRRALTLIPKPDIAIHVRVNPSVQKSRLLGRRRSEPPMARVFEAGDNTNLQFPPVVESVSALLRQRGRSRVVVELEQLSSVDSVINAIAETLVSTSRQPIAVRSEVSDRSHVCETSIGCEDHFPTAGPPAPESVHQGQPATDRSADEQAEGFARASIWALLTYVLGAGLTSGAQFLIAFSTPAATAFIRTSGLGCRSCRMAQHWV